MRRILTDMRLTEKQLRSLVREAMELPPDDYRVKARRLAEEFADQAKAELRAMLYDLIREQPTDWWSDVPPAVFETALRREMEKIVVELHAEFWRQTKGGTPKRIDPATGKLK